MTMMTTMPFIALCTKLLIINLIKLYNYV